MPIGKSFIVLDDEKDAASNSATSGVDVALNVSRGERKRAVFFPDEWLVIEPGPQ